MRIPKNPASAGFLAMAVCLGLLMPCGARAAERISLANGFEVECDHHVAVEGKIRVFLKPAAENYIELMPEAIVGFEALPDPPPEKIVETAPPKPLLSVDARLTPADLHQLLSKAGSEHHVDADLLASLVKAESGGNVHARSKAGAQGLMQLMPGTARELGVSDSFIPEQNVSGGAAYLDALLQRYHDNIALALAAYNAGPAAVDHYRGIPPYRETRIYVARVIHEFNRRVAARRKVGMTAQLSAEAGAQQDAKREMAAINAVHDAN